MKTRSIVFAFIVVLFSSCLVKSLHPFYTKKSISFDSSLVGTWKQKEKTEWVIEDMRAKVLKENKVNSIDELSETDRNIYKEYEGSYFVTIKGSGHDTFFIAVPFKIDNQLFLDFSPIYLHDDSNSLTEKHLVGTHSLVKLDTFDGGKISLKWFDEKRIKELFEQKRIKIKHEKIRNSLFEEEILLTAKPKELQKFIKKYMASGGEDKWKTDTKYTLTRDYTKP